MKLSSMILTFKCPDAVDRALDDAFYDIYDDDDRHHERQAYRKKLAEFVKWGKYISVEFTFDGDKTTATVLPS